MIARLTIGFVMLTAFMFAQTKPAPKAAASKPAPPSKFLVYVGTYTVRNSKGIYAYSYETASGKLTELGLAAAMDNPSFVVPSADGRFLYAVDETGKYKGQSSGGVTAFSIDSQTGKLTEINETASRGADPCHISIDK